MTGLPVGRRPSIGAGGGSIAWVDDGGLLHVGPQSAGADPGPACYGRGGTRADGHRRLRSCSATSTRTTSSAARCALDAERGARRRSREHVARAARARRARGRRGGPARSRPSSMVARDRGDHASTRASTRATPVLVGGGGAAGLNAVAIARRLGCPAVVIPHVGAGAERGRRADLRPLAELRAARSARPTRDFDYDGVNGVLARARAPRRSAFIDGPGAGASRAAIEFSVEARYPHQIWELEVPAAREPDPTDADARSAARRLPRRPPRGLRDRRRALAGSSSRAGTREPRCRLREPVQTTAATEPRRGRAATGDVYCAGRGLVAVRSGGSTRSRRRAAHRPGDRRDADDDRRGRPRRGVYAAPDAGLCTSCPTRAAEGGDARRRGVDGVRLAVISNRFDAVVASMMNTIFRSGRSGVLNSAHDFSCCVLTRRAPARDGRREPADPHHERPGPDRPRRCWRCIRSFARGDAFLHNSPYNGNSHAADHCAVRAGHRRGRRHRFTVLAKAHQADCGNSQPTTYIAGRATSTKRARCSSTRVRVQQRLRGQRGHPADVPAAHPRARPVVGRLPRAARRGPGRRAASCSSSARELGWDDARDVRRRLVRLQRAADGDGDPRSCPRAASRSRSRHDPVPRRPGRSRRQGDDRRRPGRGG